LFCLAGSTNATKFPLSSFILKVPFMYFAMFYSSPKA
jgi:hypothetical protein